jgi:phosphate transport system substrate-binding protein
MKRYIANSRKHLLLRGAKQAGKSFILFAVILCNSCGKTNDDGKTTHCPCFERDLPTGGNWPDIPPDWEAAESDFAGIENISFENYPKVDGSTSASILNTMVACKLLGIGYKWIPPLVEEWFLQYKSSDIPEAYGDFFGARVVTSQTHGAFMNLIDGNADIILTHRTISPDEKARADAAGVTLIETSIALDAFVFVVNRDNPVKSLTVSQIQEIYTAKITNWSQVGGNKANMKVYTRPRNSGSEEVFRTLVMNDLEPADFPEAAIGSMAWVFKEVIDDVNSICYSFNTYKDFQARKPCNEVPVIAINGICPTENTIKNGTYPFISEVRVAIRSDLDPDSMAYKLYEWLQSENAKYTITECGFIPK